MYPIVSTNFLSSSSFISSEIFSYPSRHPNTASAVCRGFKQVQTFIFSTLSTVSRSVNIKPPFSSSGLPFGNASSITRYSHSSAFTNGATYVFLDVITGSSSSIPSFFRSSSTEASGRGVILSIMVHGNVTFSLQFTYALNPASVSLFSSHFSANVLIAAYSLSPLWEQLSMLTIATGFSPA